MTSPKITTTKRQGSRFYVHPTTNETVVGVTSVLNMLPKDFLKFWSAKLVAETAYDGFGKLAAFVTDADRDGAVDWLKRAPQRSTGGAADVGSEVHDLVESLSRGNEVPPLHPDLAGYIEGYHSFVAAFEPEYLFLEETVWSETHGYAGSFDAIARIGDEVVLIDNKTTRSGVHAEVSLQLSAYQRADYILHPDGSKSDLPEIDAAAVLHLRPDDWGLYPVQTSDELFEVFLALMKVHNYEKNLRKAVVGRKMQA